MNQSDIPNYPDIKMLSNKQFSCGDQLNDSRALFAQNDFKKCIKCNNNMEQKEYIAAYRFRASGDAYGTDVFTCNKCNWITSFMWDEASEIYYYETTYFKLK